MYPILFDGNATKWETFGIGVLTRAISCEVEENRNGSYELEMKYPVSGKLYKDIQLRSLIVAKPNYTDAAQPFRVYKISKPINGVVTINAQHISYDLSGYVAAPFKTAGAKAALAKFTQAGAAYPADCPFIFSTDITDSKETTISYPQSIRAILGKGEGNMLETYGGEWHFDGYKCELKKNRGEDRGVAIRYGKNMTDLKQEENNAEVYTAIYPFFWSEEDSVLVTLPEKVIQVNNAQGYSRVKPVDLSSYFKGQPTAEDLRIVARSYIDANEVGIPKVNLTIKFINQATEQERVDLCDNVKVIFDALGVSADAKCIRTKWDVLKDRYIEAELGTPKDDLAKTIVTISKATKDLESIQTNLNATAKEIRTELSETDASLQQRITQTAETLTSDYTSLNSQTGQELRGVITQTAEALTSDYTSLNSQTGQELRGVITQTAEALTSDYTSLNSQTGQELRGVITQTAEALTSDYTNKLDETESHLTQTASEIKAEVKNNKEELQSSIDVQANRIGLVVEGTGSNASIKPAAIVAAINNGESSIKISASHITLDGRAVANSLSSQDINCASITAESLRSYYAGKGNLLINEIEDYLLDREVGILDGVVYDVSVSGNVLTLKRYGQSDVTFSKATSLSGTWSGGTYTVTASPQGNTLSLTPGVRLNGNGASNFSAEMYSSESSGAVVRNSALGYLTINGKKVNVRKDSNTGAIVAQIDASSLYNSGWTTAAGNVSWPGTNTTTKNATFKAPNSTVDGEQVSRTYYLDMASSGYSSSTKVYLRNPDDIAVAALGVGDVYTAGESAGRAAVTATVTLSEYPSNNTVVKADAYDGTRKLGGTYIYLELNSDNNTVEARTSWSAYGGEVVGYRDCSSIYNNGRNAVTLGDFTWSALSGSMPTYRTLSISTSGRGTNPSKSKTLYLTAGSWSDGSIPIYIRDGSTSGSAVAQSSVSAPSATVELSEYSGSSTIVKADAYNGTRRLGGTYVYLELNSSNNTVEARTNWSANGGEVVGYRDCSSLLSGLSVDISANANNVHVVDVKSKKGGTLYGSKDYICLSLDTDDKKVYARASSFTGDVVGWMDCASIYNTGYNAGGATAWLYYNKSGSYQATLDYDKEMSVGYTDSNGNVHYIGYWKTPANNATSISTSDFAKGNYGPGYWDSTFDTGGKLYCGAINASNVKSRGYIYFSVTCKGTQRNCYITVN